MVLITRPQHQALRTAALLREHGIAPIIFPTLDIIAIAPGSHEAADLKNALDDLPRSNYIIFVSANAVEFGWPWILQNGNAPNSAQIVAIGQATAWALNARGVKSVLQPSNGNDSEALLALDQFSDESRIKHKHVIIFRGKSDSGGRTFLGDNLTERGAVVRMAECYLRRTAVVTDENVAALWAQLVLRQIDAVNVQSVETFESLIEILHRKQPAQAEIIGVLQQSVFVVPHHRIAAALGLAGISNIVVSGAGDLALCQSLKALKREHGNQ